MGRAPCCEKVGLKRGRWSAQEDEILTRYIQANGEGSWRALPKNAGLLRCGKSCRLRWINYLRSDLKRGNISAHEEQLIIKLHSSLGNRWSQIASHLPGRTDNEIKNYWNSHLSKKICAFRRPASRDQAKQAVTTDPITPNNANINITATKRKGGRTSRWAMKKNGSNNTHQESTAAEKTNHNSTVAAVPVPPTPALEKEGLSITSDDGIEFEEFMVLEGDSINKEDKVEGSEEAGEASNNDGESCEDGSLRSGGDRETETTQEGQAQGNIGGGSGGGGELCLSDMVDPWLLEDEGGGVSSLTEERERIYEVSCFDGPECTNNNAQASMPSVFECDNYWDNWEIGMDDQLMNNHNESQTWWEDKPSLLSWLWEDDDDCQITQQNDPEKRNPNLPLIL